ncbi:MAG TPA: GTPase domain-containing protein [Burkholderiaceae bacterium]|nr:GTPase domain-containing protein [Burkholderiaceae bacterium]
MPDSVVSLSLVSHTNAGKTTLARTLLGRDVGQVRDAPHVTEFADVYTMLETPQGERLQLWDTPGFGDSVRLVKRLRQSATPIGWFLSAIWDRWRDRPFWSSQQALRNVRDEADVMLYLVNVSESPEAAAFVAAEMELLAWVGKPVIVLLNQLGPPRDAALEAADIARWRRHLAAFAPVRDVLPLDAFARCWVQELTLLRAIENVLADGERRARMGRLRAAWQAQRQRAFDAAMRSIATSLARLAHASETLPDAGGKVGAALRANLRHVGAAIGLGKPVEDTPAAQAQRALAQRLDDEVRANTRELIELHGLEGEAHEQILTRLATHYQLRLRLDETKAAVWGGMVTGALVGLKADVLSGGLTLGGGLLAGGLIGALGAAGLARCVNLVRGTARSWVAWNAEALDQMVDAALLRYLAVAHFGRGRGEWAQSESPPFWKDVIAQALAPHREALSALWASRGARDGRRGDPDDEVDDGEIGLLAAALEPIVHDAASAALERLYGNAADAALRESAQPAPVISA